MRSPGEMDSTLCLPGRSTPSNATPAMNGRPYNGHRIGDQADEEEWPAARLPRASPRKRTAKAVMASDSTTTMTSAKVLNAAAGSTRPTVAASRSHASASSSGYQPDLDSAMRGPRGRRVVRRRRRNAAHQVEHPRGPNDRKSVEVVQRRSNADTEAVLRVTGKTSSRLASSRWTIGSAFGYPFDDQPLPEPGERRRQHRQRHVPTDRQVVDKRERQQRRAFGAIEQGSSLSGVPTNRRARVRQVLKQRQHLPLALLEQALASGARSPPDRYQRRRRDPHPGGDRRIAAGVGAKVPDDRRCEPPYRSVDQRILGRRALVVIREFTL